MAENTIPVVQLRTAGQPVDMPQLGFGVWEVSPDDVVGAVTKALDVGYRSIDTAKIYGNEEGVGEAIANHSVDRDDIFVTTKVWNDAQRYDSTKQAMNESLARLDMSYVDLYLIHWPCPNADTYVDTWKALLDLREEGKAKAIGVCNFHVAHLERLKKEGLELPAINQIELHPYLTQTTMRSFHADHDIVTEDWSPLAVHLGAMKDPVIVGIANDVNRAPAQVILRWHLQLGSVVIPRSVTPSRIESNFDLFDFVLTDDQMTAISDLNQMERQGPDPDEFNLDAV